jgi:hypothetical protein
MAILGDDTSTNNIELYRTGKRRFNQAYPSVNSGSPVGHKLHYWEYCIHDGIYHDTNPIPADLAGQPLSPGYSAIALDPYGSN